MAYERPPARKMYIVLDDDDQDPTHPEQVSILLFLPEFFFVLLSDSLRSGGVLGCEGECLAVRKRGLGGLGLDGLTLRLAASWVLGGSNSLSRELVFCLVLKFGVGILISTGVKIL